MIISLAQIMVLLLILARIAGVFISAPLFSSRSFNPFLKTGLAVWMALVLWFVTPVAPPHLPPALWSFVLALVIEVLIGFTIGFICNLIFLTVQFAGEMMDLQMGLSVATLMDPVFGGIISIVGRLTFWIAMIIFLTMDGHHLILSALHQSFKALPVGYPINMANPNLVSQIVALVSTFWVLAFKLAAPVILLIFLSDFAFGIVSRVAPQVNVFMLGFQVKPLLGIFGLLMITPYLARYVVRLLEMMNTELLKFFVFLK